MLARSQNPNPWVVRLQSRGTGLAGWEGRGLIEQSKNKVPNCLNMQVFFVSGSLSLPALGSPLHG